jgi:hypothetical protein
MSFDTQSLRHWHKMPLECESLLHVFPLLLFLWADHEVPIHCYSLNCEVSFSKILAVYLANGNIS